MFLFALIVPLFNWIFVLAKFIETEAIDTARNILANEFLFRINIINELIISVILIILAISLYVMLKSENKNLTLFALFLIFTNALLLGIPSPY